MQYIATKYDSLSVIHFILNSYASTTGEQLKKMKIFIPSIFIVIFLTDGMEVTDKDINSPLVSYLFAKLQ